MQQIEGVVVKGLSPHKDSRGMVLELLRADDPSFEKFGQAYITTCRQGIAKAWHYHEQQSEYFTCVKGILKLVLYDGRKGSPTKGEVNEFRISLDNPLLVKIPPFVYHGFECGDSEELLAVCIKTEPYDREHPDKINIRFDDPKIPYKWESKEGG
ncbi:dTDP-4-dehydrorhamnose 3,5-epimerase family protein [Candidatus Woesearchaeota archaeon]|nr:dTDP-4-dehydrorhamnose 3,5-epimerase family protein [Candidatus Woesearchaeota archaeon]